ncbi:hypothetical protein EE612_000023 [Oryza sativa]|nr:hypothetical protein EE612_000023 [Oryza sativa]
MPHLAASPTSAAAAAPASARVAFLRPGRVPARRCRQRVAFARTWAPCARRSSPRCTTYSGSPRRAPSTRSARPYRRMARKYHPDVSPPDAAAENTRRFIEVQEALRDALRPQPPGHLRPRPRARASAGLPSPPPAASPLLLPGRQVWLEENLGRPN